MSLLSLMAVVFAFTFAGILVAIFALMGVFLYLGYMRVEEFLACLENCYAIQQRKFLMYCGPWGRIMLMGAIAGIVTFPGVFLKHGGVSKSDLDNFPFFLKRKLVVLHILSIALLVAGLLVGGALIVTWHYAKGSL